MSKTKLGVRDGKNEIPTISPSLMPFRIAYSGPAPISTYFLTRPFIDADEKRRRLAAGTLAGEGAENVVDNVMDPPSGDLERVRDEPEEQKDAQGGQPVVETTETTEDQPGAETNVRLLAAFRGRKVVSHNVSLPDGYTGLFLTSGSATKPATSDNASREDRVGKGGNSKATSAAVKAGDRAKALKAKAEAKLKASGKGTRRSRKVEVEEVGEEALADGDEIEPEDKLVKLEGDDTAAGEGVPADPMVEDKIFEIAGQFQGFTLWHPDAPVDEARDEYTRSLREWIALAGEIHRV